MTDETPLRVVGMGPLPMPGERRRRDRSAQEARRLVGYLDEVEARSQGERGTTDTPNDPED